MLACFKGQGRITISSSDGEEKSVELKDVGHGAFTYFLEKGLRGEADRDDDGVVTLDELWRYLRGNVTDASGKAGKPQTPVLMGEMTHDLALTLNPVATERKKQIADAIAALTGLGDDKLTTPEAELCLAILRREPRTEAERDIAAELPAVMSGTVPVGSFRKLVGAVLRSAAGEQLGSASMPVYTISGPRHHAIGSLTGCAVGVAISGTRIAILGSDRSLAALRLPAPGQSAAGTVVWRRKDIVEELLSWRHPLCADEDRVVVVSAAQVLVLNGARGKTEHWEKLTAPVKAHVQTPDGIWLLTEDRALSLLDVRTGALHSRPLPGGCPCGALAAAKDGVIAFGKSSGRGLWLFRQAHNELAPGRHLSETDAAFVQASAAADNLLLVVESEREGATAALWSIGQRGELQIVSSKEKVPYSTAGVLAAPGCFICVGDRGSAYVRPYDAQASGRVCWEGSSPLLLPPVLCEDVVAMVTRERRGYARVAGVKFAGPSFEGEEIWEIHLPPLHAPGCASAGCLYFADHLGNVHCIRAD
jgi:hypothetical protein